MTLAPMRFTQPSIMMLVVGIASLPIENQHREPRLVATSDFASKDNIQYGGHFTSRYGGSLAYDSALSRWLLVLPHLLRHEPDLGMVGAALGASKGGGALCREAAERPAATAGAREALAHGLGVRGG